MFLFSGSKENHTPLRSQPKTRQNSSREMDREILAVLKENAATPMPPPLTNPLNPASQFYSSLVPYLKSWPELDKLDLKGQVIQHSTLGDSPVSQRPGVRSGP